MENQILQRSFETCPAGSQDVIKAPWHLHMDTKPDRPHMEMCGYDRTHRLPWYTLGQPKLQETQTKRQLLLAPSEGMHTYRYVAQAKTA